MRRTNVVHLVCHILQPVLCRFNARDHLRQFRAHDGLRVQRFAECLPLLRPPARESRWLGTKDLRCEQYGTYLRHSSTMSRCVLKLIAMIAHRSWLKLLRMTPIPLPSLPSVFDTGTRTLSNVTNAVPAEAEYAVLIGLVESPSQRGTRMTVYPPLVLQPTVK